MDSCNWCFLYPNLQSTSENFILYINKENIDLIFALFLTEQRNPNLGCYKKAYVLDLKTLHLLATFSVLD
jgi:hypothetical protein